MREDEHKEREEIKKKDERIRGIEDVKGQIEWKREIRLYRGKREKTTGEIEVWVYPLKKKRSYLRNIQR